VLVQVAVGVSKVPEGFSDVLVILGTPIEGASGVGVGGGIRLFKDRIHALVAASTNTPAPTAAQKRCLEAGGLRGTGVTGSGVGWGRMSTMVANSWRMAVLGACIARRAAYISAGV